MEFPSSLNKAKPTGLWQMECPAIGWSHSKIVFFEWNSKQWIIAGFSEPAAAYVETREAKRKALAAKPQVT
jgi:hypothetical protein